MSYFTEEELQCKCGCGMGVEDALVNRLDRARHLAGIPFVISSGARCSIHNKNVGGSPNSSHMNGTAVDIATGSSSDRMTILAAVLAAGFNRVGVAKSFIHVDVDDNKVGDVCWVY